MISKLKRIVSPPARRPIRWVLNNSLDLFDFLSGRRDSLAPPRNMRFVGSGDYQEIGREFYQYFLELGGLQPGDRVLDVGCGTGRMAIPLTAYLGPSGSYEGLDVVRRAVRWSAKHISPRFPNFHFTHADIYNKGYNPGGKTPASQYVFPYDDSSFDFVFLTSVFTHMLPADVENYLRQISRVMKTSGRCFVTFFLMNEESSALVKTEKLLLDFKFGFEEYFTINALLPEAAIAYNEIFVRGLFGKTGLRIEEPIRYGSWCGRKHFLSFQDIVLAMKA
jgi:SAM-dependent methyltransferase